MRRSLRWVSLLIALNITATSTFVDAQAKKPKTIREELPDTLRKEWDLGLALYGDGNYRGALTQFQRVYDTTKNPRILGNMANAEREMKNYARATALFRRQLAEGEKTMSAQDVKDVKDAINALKPFVSTLEITSNVPGALVTIDGAEMGTTPLAQPIEVSIGPRSVKLTKEKFREMTKTIEIASGKPAAAKFELVPEVLMADATVTAEGAPKANIRIDGIEMGPAPFRGKVEVGKAHKFEAYAPNYVTAESSIDVPRQEPVTVVLRLSELRAEGRVAIIARPAGAIISIDQKVVGTDKWDGVLSTGGHQVKISKSGYIDHVQEIGVANDQVRTVDATLRQDPSRGAVYWAVGAALVVIGGGVTAFFVARGKDAEPVAGTLPERVMPTWHR